VLPAKFLGGGDAVIRTAFNPAYLLDALKSLTGDAVVIDIDQNATAATARFWQAGHPVPSMTSHTLVVMPVNAGLPASVRTSARNFPKDLEEEGSP